MLEASPELVARLGRSRRVLPMRYPAATTMTALVDALAAQIAAAGPARVDVLGSSYGGWVAQCLVRRHPALVRHLVLLHSFVLRPADARQFRIGLALWRALPDGLLRRLSSLRVRRVLRPVGDEAERERLAAAMAAELAAPGSMETLRRQNLCMLDSCTSFSVAPGDLTRHDGRVLIVDSDDDPVIRAADRERLRAAYPGAQVRTFHGTGHVTARAAPEAFAQAVDAFLAGEVGAAP
jgi:pimeloyl-ACP methyl ester carboxylesterase